jgi:hypothetical protein
MHPSIPRFAALVVFGSTALAGAAESEKEATRTAQDDRACSGVANENTKMKELRRELGAYFGQSIPEELQLRVRKHIDMVAKLKAECDQQKEPAALARKE